jgi:site-specific recombinase XerD
VARRLSTLWGFYSYAQDEDAIGRNPVARVRRPKVGTDTTSMGPDREALVAHIRQAANDSPRSHALVLLLGLNGLRISEALGADVAALLIERGHRVLTITRKGGTKATIPLAPRTAEAVDAYVSGHSGSLGKHFVNLARLHWRRWECIMEEEAVPQPSEPRAAARVGGLGWHPGARSQAAPYR